MDLSIIVPALREPYLEKTVRSLLDNSRLPNIEIFVVMDLCELSDSIRKDKRVKIFPQTRAMGMRGSTNLALSKAKGKYIMKIDAHSLSAEGYDKIMAENCAEDWLMIPRRYSLDEDAWKIREHRGSRDYHYFIFPILTSYGHSFSCREWYRMDRKRSNPKYDIDDLMTFQGSCWFANREYFMKKVGYLDGRDETYKNFAQEPIEIGLKYWLGGGKTKINKKTWYAHLSKRKHHYMNRLFTRRYKKPKDVIATYNWVAKHWMNNKEPGMIHKFEWLIDKFWPIPEWPKNWKEMWKTYEI